MEIETMTRIGPAVPDGAAEAWSPEGDGGEHAALSKASPKSSFRETLNLQIIPIFQDCVLALAVPSISPAMRGENRRARGPRRTLGACEGLPDRRDFGRARRRLWSTLGVTEAP
ncbi:MAG: hypothetical protein WAJ85_02000 [Candidatus Baltobacteraceae bacterium]